MKIKLLIPMGSQPFGAEVDAAISSSKQQAVFYDYDIFYTIGSGSFEILENRAEKQTGGEVPSLRQLLGQDVRTIEFK